jgi:hypothetical protein
MAKIGQKHVTYSFETVWEKDFYEPKRFFSMFEDEAIVKVMQRRFQNEIRLLDPDE